MDAVAHFLGPNRSISSSQIHKCANSLQKFANPLFWKLSGDIISDWSSFSQEEQTLSKYIAASIDGTVDGIKFSDGVPGLIHLLLLAAEKVRYLSRFTDAPSPPPP